MDKKGMRISFLESYSHHLELRGPRIKIHFLSPVALDGPSSSKCSHSIHLPPPRPGEKSSVDREKIDHSRRWVVKWTGRVTNGSLPDLMATHQFSSFTADQLIISLHGEFLPSPSPGPINRHRIHRIVPIKDPHSRDPDRRLFRDSHCPNHHQHQHRTVGGGSRCIVLCSSSSSDGICVSGRFVLSLG